MTAVLLDRLSTEERHALGKSFSSLPTDEDQWGRYEREVFDGLFGAYCDVLGKNPDREGMVQLLSVRFPSTVGYNIDTEYYVSGLCARQFKNSVSILSEAFQACKDSAVRHKIATAVRHAFAGLGVKGDSDRAFVENAMEFYKKNKSRLTLNRAYLKCFDFALDHNYEDHPMFILDSKPRGRQGEK